MFSVCRRKGAGGKGGTGAFLECLLYAKRCAGAEAMMVVRMLKTRTAPGLVIHMVQGGKKRISDTGRWSLLKAAKRAGRKRSPGESLWIWQEGSSCRGFGERVITGDQESTSQVAEEQGVIGR